MIEKKSIIIDGIDVSGCIFYQANFEEDFDVKIRHFCSNWHNSCESVNNNNCYFKQLERKKQELKQIEQKLKHIKEIIGDSHIFKEEDYGLDNITRELKQIID